MIEEYRFGSIKVDGANYTRDIMILPGGRVKPNWWRIEGHKLHLEDLRDLLDAKPDIIIIGTGFYGAMDVPSEVVEAIRGQSIEVLARKTYEAVRLYNELSSKDRRVAAALHLTC
ncbi:MAG: Mth938-like domain-containing protein [Nitrososphaerota archaeon]|nr:Mth938-like domain-containing protein [Candidatus Bathyarchaeota archaeon]MDW8062110.1 Mth938-like domain-containing protein [Nitrososphaerota archaeon]